jgi:hypothetical protein
MKSVLIGNGFDSGVYAGRVLLVKRLAGWGKFAKISGRTGPSSSLEIESSAEFARSRQRRRGNVPGGKMR